ncbi:PBAN-type neuropeptides-like isoform X2 [Euwallacea fornicatus]|uniref:PBAN-type neuropeptides-like isoform X2 n=1 Tax=Euwallacea fornicatus TaxID=995702 RepID=UPI00338F2897
MGRISILNCCAIFTILFLFYAQPSLSFESPNSHEHKEASPMWFGPRMGRKKRNPGESNFRNGKDQQTMGLLDVLRDSPLVVVAVNDGNNKQPSNFVPRLGRESGEPLFSWTEDEADALASRPNGVNPFSPRLGRNNFNPFSPRLGRDNEVLLK